MIHRTRPVVLAALAALGFAASGAPADELPTAVRAGETVSGQIEPVGEADEYAVTLLVGDRPLTDIRMAQESGMHSALVMTGATDAAVLASSPVIPDYVLGTIAEIVPPSLGTTI